MMRAIKEKMKVEPRRLYELADIIYHHQHVCFGLMFGGMQLNKYDECAQSNSSNE
jgi:hypothetical protein